MKFPSAYTLRIKSSNVTSIRRIFAYAAHSNCGTSHTARLRWRPRLHIHTERDPYITENENNKRAESSLKSATTSPPRRRFTRVRKIAAGNPAFPSILYSFPLVGQGRLRVRTRAGNLARGDFERSSSSGKHVLRGLRLRHVDR